jgi:hypothetical protein
MDLTQKPVGFWIGETRGGRAQRVEVCPACGRNGVAIRVQVREQKRTAYAYAHVLGPGCYEQVHRIMPKSLWRAPDTLRQRLQQWLTWALAAEPGPRRKRLGSLAARLGSKWQVVAALPRCRKLPAAAFLAALEAESRLWPTGPIRAVEWSVMAGQEIERWDGIESLPADNSP